MVVGFFFFGGGEGEDERRTSYSPLQISHSTRLHACHLNNYLTFLSPPHLPPLLAPSRPLLLSSIIHRGRGGGEWGMAEIG